MEDIFISHIHINKVRHLQNLDIPLSATERQHLILTGSNGSGKTSFLLALKAYLRNIENHVDMNMIGLREGLNVKLTNSDLANNAFVVNNFIYTYFDSKRISNFTKVIGPQKLELQNIYGIETKVNTNFIQYIVNLRYDMLDAKDTNNKKEVQEIDAWFEKFTNALRYIFEDNTLTLEFDRPNYNYNIILRGHEKFDLNTLSDGYSAVINILTELILRMEKKSSRFYDIQGIVLIDEIETHLHIDLQKKILPFLTAFFPKIQFIVTTHSPFVLTSLSNAVIYDLEKRQPIHDLSGYSVEAIIEAYFGQDKYASILTDKVNRYERLMSGNGLTEEERDEKSYLKGYFKNLPYFLAPELQVKIQQIELAQLGK